MTTAEPQPGFEDLPTRPGLRWVEVSDGRATSRTRWEQVPVDAPDPDALDLTPEQAARTRAMVRTLLVEASARQEAPVVAVTVEEEGP